MTEAKQVLQEKKNSTKKTAGVFATSEQTATAQQYRGLGIAWYRAVILALLFLSMGSFFMIMNNLRSLTALEARVLELEESPGARDTVNLLCEEAVLSQRVCDRFSKGKETPTNE